MLTPLFKARWGTIRVTNLPSRVAKRARARVFTDPGSVTLDPQPHSPPDRLLSHPFLGTAGLPSTAYAGSGLRGRMEAMGQRASSVNSFSNAVAVDPDDPQFHRRGSALVPGLWREEVAQMAGVSTDYYTRLEQGRNIHPSRSVLDSVARRCALDPAEHAHMMDLLQNCGGSRSPGPGPEVRPGAALLEAVGEVPAMVLGRPTGGPGHQPDGKAALCGLLSPPNEQHLTRWLILDPAARELFRDWKGRVGGRWGIGVDVERHPNDPEASQFVGELGCAHSKHFRQWWAGHRVATRASGTVSLRHPTVGELELDFENLSLDGDVRTRPCGSSRPSPARRRPTG